MIGIDLYILIGKHIGKQQPYNTLHLVLGKLHERGSDPPHGPSMDYKFLTIIRSNSFDFVSFHIIRAEVRESNSLL